MNNRNKVWVALPPWTIALKKFVSNNKTLNTNTTATFPNVTGKMKNESCFPILELKEIFENNSAKQKPPPTFAIAESNANEIVLVSDELKPFELSENNFEMLLPEKPPMKRGNKNIAVMKITTDIMSLLAESDFCIFEFQSWKIYLRAL